MRLRRRKPDPAPRDYPAILFRISTPDGVIVQADSEHLYYTAIYGSQGFGCTPACPPGCDRHGWLNLITAGGEGFGAQCPAGEFSTVPLRIEVKPLRLPDPFDA
jgi:hypothetical protein